mgnify:CR=1 FL=1
MIALMVATGSREGVATFRLSKSPDASSFTDTDFLRSELELTKITVPAIRLDKLVNELGNQFKNKNTVLMKIDVEGYGLEVIRGAREIISRFKPYIIFEIHRTFDETDELRAVKELVDLGYKFKVVEYRSNKNFILFLYPSGGKLHGVL